jgi:thiol-disulfide isomerase/thioredoxin
MKKFILILLSISYLSINAQGIEFFKGTFDEAKAYAQKEDKLIFMDCYTTWCGPCKRMSKNVFTKKEAGDYFNENFVNVKMDMEKGEGKALAKKYSVGSYPTLLFLDYKGDVVYQTKGARRDATSLIALGKKALLPNKKTLQNLQSKWDSGNRDQKFLKEFMKVKTLLGEDNNEPFKAYLNSLSAEEKKNEDNIKFIYKQTTQVSSAGMSFIYENKSLLKDVFGAKTFDKKIKTIATESISVATKNKDNKIVAEVKSMLKKLKPANYKKQSNYIETKYYGKTKQWNAYDKSVTKYLKKYKKNNDVALKNVAWNYYMNINDTKKLQKAAKWISKAISLNNSYENNLTQAYLLYKMKNYNEAQDAVEYALILSKDSTKKTKNAQILKGKIEKALKESSALSK